MIKEITNETGVSVEKSLIQNGTLYTATSIGSDLYVYGALLFDENLEGIYVVCQGKEKENINDCKKYFNKSNIQVKLQ